MPSHFAAPATSTRHRCRVRTACHRKPLTVANRARRVASSMSCVVLAVAIAGAGSMSTARAAVPDPFASASVTRVFDGTGHGTPDASFVTTVNGFPVGDDSPTDAVVSSGDTVEYRVGLTFAATSNPRTVTVTVRPSEFLSWSPVGDLLCRNGHFVKATRSGNRCVFAVPAGATETLTAPLDLTALDTGARAVDKQGVTVEVARDDGTPYSQARSDSLTVVSVPAADVVLTQPPFTGLAASLHYISIGDPLDWAGPASGSFLATPVPLGHQGYSITKGMSSSAPWSGHLDVTAFPAGTTWQIGGAAAKVKDGAVTIPPSRGPVRVTFTVPDGWPDLVEGQSVDFPVHLRVDPSSFSVDPTLLNNVTGWQPGDQKGPDESTADAATGALAGRPLPNNDFAVARVLHAPPMEPRTGPWRSCPRR